MVALLFAMLLQTGAPGLVTIARGTTSGVEERRETIVRSAADWDALWKVHGAGQAAPAIDPAKSVVIGVFLGIRPSGGYSVEITGTRRDGETLVVEYVERTPGRGALVSQALTSPFQIAALPRYDGPIRFQPAREPAAAR